MGPQMHPIVDSRFRHDVLRIHKPIASVPGTALVRSAPRLRWHIRPVEEQPSDPI
jgi:hypothetical protein